MAGQVEGRFLLGSPKRLEGTDEVAVVPLAVFGSGMIGCLSVVAHGH